MSKSPNKKEGVPPSLRPWLERSLKGLPPLLVTQGQKELKAILKVLTDEKLVWDVDWETTPVHAIGDTPNTIERLKKAAADKRKPPQVEPSPPIVNYNSSITPEYSRPNMAPTYALNGNDPASGYVTLQPPTHLSHSHHHQQPHPLFQVQQQPAYPATQEPPRYSDQTNNYYPQIPLTSSYPTMPSNYQYQQQPFVVSQPQERQSRFHSAPDDYRPQASQWSQPNPRNDDQRFRDEPVKKTKWGPEHENDSTLRDRRRSTEQQDFIPFDKRPRPRSPSPSPTPSPEPESRPTVETVASALRDYLFTRGGRIALTKLKDFYDLNLHLRSIAKAKSVVASKGSGLVLDGDDVVLESLAKKQNKTDRKSKSSTDMNVGDESPSKKAARAARFGNDLILSSTGASTYEKITQDSQKVAAALEEAERLGTEVDWSSLVVKGTCTHWEKPFLRLTAPPDPSTVRPEPVLHTALQNIMARLRAEGTSAYSWASDQMKSIRQDLRVQHIQNDFTVEVYEAHAKAALEYGQPDYHEFNQSCTQLRDLYDHGLGNVNSRAEFAAYLLLYHVYCKAKYTSPASVVTLSTCNPATTKDPEKHALAVYLAIETENWKKFFRLYEISPGLGKAMLRPLVTYVRLLAVRTSCQAAKSIPRDYLTRTLSFASNDEFTTFCEKFHLSLMADQESIDAKPTLVKVNEALNEGTVWS